MNTSSSLKMIKNESLKMIKNEMDSIGCFWGFQNESFTTSHGARDPSVPKILVVLTDGQSTDSMATALMADQLHRAGIKVVTIGIGQNVRKSELTVIATDRNHVFTADDFKSLATLQKDLQMETCRSTSNAVSFDFVKFQIAPIESLE